MERMTEPLCSRCFRGDKVANPHSEVDRVRHFQVDHKLFAADFKRMLLADER